MSEYPHSRSVTRVAIRIRAEVTSATLCAQGLELRDLSVRGAYVYSDSAPEEGSSCVLRLVLEGGEEQLVLPVTGQVVRVEEEGFAVLFEEIPAESFDHLRRMVLINSSDPRRVESELAALCGIKPI